MGARRADRPAARAGPRRLVDERAGPVELGLAVGQVVGDRLEGADRLAELLAVLGVLDGDLLRVVRGRRPPTPPSRISASSRTAVPRRPAGARGPEAVGGGRPARRRGRPGTGCRTPAVSCWVSVTPAACGSTRNRSTSSSPSPVRASTSSRVAAGREGDVALGPGQREAVAVVGRGPGLDAAWPEAAVGLEPRRGEHGRRRRRRGAATRPAAPSVPPAAMRAGRGHAAHEVRRRRQRPAQLLVQRPRPRAGSCPSRRAPRGPAGPSRSSAAELLPEVGRVADRVVLQLAHDGRAAQCSAQQARAPPRAASPAPR